MLAEGLLLRRTVEEESAGRESESHVHEKRDWIEIQTIYRPSMRKGGRSITSEVISSKLPSLFRP